MPTPTVDTPPRSDARTETPPYCSAKWKDALAVCRQNLSEPDLEHLKTVETCDDLLSNISSIQFSVIQASGPSLVQRITPCLDPLRSFVTLLVAALGSNSIQTALMWGVMSLLIQAAGRTETLLPETIDMLKDLSHDLEMFQIYETAFAGNAQMGDQLMDIFVDIITFWTQAIRFLQRNKHGTTATKSWPNVYKKFEETSKRIRKRSRQIKERANALAVTHPQYQGSLLEKLDHLGLSHGVSSAAVSTDDSVYPCHNIPFPRNLHFYGREEELASICAHLDDQSAPKSFRSFALYGIGGTGKTQTALTYAYRQTDAAVDAVLWFNCETSLALARSFYDVAVMLQLEGVAKDETSDQNRFLVLKWLRRTARSWVMIMDNVEDLDLVRNAWPVASHGRVLVTSRNDVVSIDPAAGGMEIEEFNDEDGCRLILSLVRRESYTETEKDAARRLSIRLGGLALALAVMSSQIRLRKKSIADFLNLYEKHSQQLNKERRGIESYYNFSLKTCWQTAIEFLSPEADQLLGVIAYLGPDAIPDALFHPDDSAKLPEALKFCADELLFEEAQEQLFSTSLVRRDPSTSMFSIHRLTQEEYRNQITRDKQQECFVLASTLLCEGFPKLNIAQSLREHWTECKLYIQHVLILCTRYQECKFRPKFKGEFDRFLELATASGRYLMECGAWQEEFKLMETAFELCEDKNGLIYAILAASIGATEMERAHCDESHRYLDKSLEIFLRIHGPNHVQVANAYNKSGNLILQDLKEGACEEAVAYYRKSMDILETKPVEVQSKIMHLLHSNTSRALRVLKQYEKSIEHAEKSRKWAVGFLGPGGHFDGLADYHVGNALYDLGRYDEAKGHWKRALEIFAKENETHPTTSAAKMKLSQIHMKRGNYDQAITILQGILIIAQLNEPSKGDKGETARFLRKSAEAHFLKGELDKAAEMKMAAEAMRKEIQGDRFETLPDEDLSYAMMNFHAIW